MESSFVTIVNAFAHFYGQHAKDIHQYLAIALAIVQHILDARQSIWARHIHFPHLLHNVYVYREYLGKVCYSIVVIFWNIYACIRWKGTKSMRPIQTTKSGRQLLSLIVTLGLLLTFLWVLVRHQLYGKALSIALLGDAFYTVFGLIEKWFMAHKKVEKWILSSLRYIAFAMACYGNGDTKLMWKHILLIFVAVYGQIQWLKSYRKLQSA